MSKIRWEHDLVEKPFCEQLRVMGWQWLEGDTDVPELTERETFREVLLKGRLTAALRKLNLRDGQPWLDDERVARAIRDLEQAAGHRLMEVNQAVTELLLKGTVVDGLPEWEYGRPQPVKFIDFENLANNDFLVINQFKVELTSGRGHVIPDAVLFVNGIPLVVAEFKSPGIQNPLQEAINQLLRYSNQRKELFPTLYNENEGVERLFHTNQLLVASNFFEARAATIGAPPEAYLEWADTSPVPMSTVTEELGMLSTSPEQVEAEQEVVALGPEQSERVGTPLFFRKPEQRPIAMRSAHATLQSQQVLAAGMLRPAHLLDLVRNFTVFQQADGKTRELVAELEAVPPATLALPDEAVEKLGLSTRFLVRAHPLLAKLRALEIGVVFSGNHNDPESWWDWADKDKQEERITRFKRKLGLEKTVKTDPLSILVVNNMLLTGFDAPVEQVLYLDRKIVAHDLLQAIARVNRTCGPKKCGYVVDYIGVARHLNDALKDYDGEDTEGALIDISVELPKLLDRRARAVAVFTDRGITDLQEQVSECVQLLEDLKIRADLINKLRMFYETLNILEHRPEVPGDVFRDAKLLGFINKVAANLYRDPALNLLGVAEKVKALINAHISARGVDPKIPPTPITDAEFEKVLQAQSSSRARATQMQHAARYHIIGFSSQNPAYARKMSEKLEEILQRFKDDWDALERELRKFIEELKQGDRNDFPDLDPNVQVPFVRLVLEECSKDRELTESQRQVALSATLEMVERIRQEVRKVGFWKNPHARELLTRRLVRDLDDAGISGPGGKRDLAQRLVALAKENHEALTRI